VTGARPLDWTSFTLEDPPRLVVDFQGARLGKVPQDVERRDGAVERVKASLYGTDGAPLARLTISLVPGAAPPQAVVEISSAGKEVRFRMKKASGPPRARAEPPPAARPPHGEPGEDDGAVIVVQGGRWRIVLGRELPLRGSGPCTRAPRPAPAPGGCSRPVLLVNESGMTRGYAGTVPGCGDWRAASVAPGVQGRTRITLEPRVQGAAAPRRAVVEVDLGRIGGDVPDAIPALATCWSASDCDWLHVLGFSATGAFAYAVGPGTADAPAAPSQLRVVHLMNDRVLLDAPYPAEGAGRLVANRFAIRPSDPWLGSTRSEACFLRQEVLPRWKRGASRT
jgi:hypothetical protein